MLAKKLLLTQAAILLLTLLASTWMLLHVFEDALLERSLDQLESVRTLKRMKIDNSLAQLRSMVESAVVHERSGKAPAVEETLAWAPRGFELVRTERRRFPECGAVPFREAIFCAPDEAEGSTDWLVWVVVRVAPSPQAEAVGVLIRLSGLEEILETRAGLRSSGESYVVDPLYRMRTPSRFTSFDRATSRVKTEPVERARRNESGKVVAADYRGVQVLSAFAPLESLGPGWAIVSEIDLEEILEPAELSKMAVIAISVCALLVSFVGANLASRRLLRQTRAAEQRRWLEGQEDERSRLARDLHDGLGQLLTWQSLRLQAAEMAPRTRSELQEGLAEASRELRAIVHGLAPPSLQQLGWREALASLCREQERATGMSIELRESGDVSTRRFSRFDETLLYRLIQETFNNATKHASASRLQVTLSDLGHGLRIRVEDDGKGFAPELLHSASALRSLRSRVALARGRLRFGNLDPGGAWIEMELPMEPA